MNIGESIVHKSVIQSNHSPLSRVWSVIHRVFLYEEETPKINTESVAGSQRFGWKTPMNLCVYESEDHEVGAGMNTTLLSDTLVTVNRLTESRIFSGVRCEYY